MIDGELHDGRTLDLDALHELLARLEQFPVTNQQIAREARRLSAPNNVTAFFETIPGEVMFSDREEVLRRAEQAELLLEDEETEPAERPERYD
jgi:hypothetical protein